MRKATWEPRYVLKEFWLVSADMRRVAVSPGPWLADFTTVTHLSLGMELLLCFARRFPDDDDDDDDRHFSLIERFPPQLGCLTIYGYRPGKNILWDELLEELQEMIVDGNETVFTRRGVGEYLRHPVPQAQRQN